MCDHPNLAALSAAATQGVWEKCGTGYICVPDGPDHAIITVDANRDTDAAFICAVVNAYREKRLVEVPEWRPIESAPRDGTPILTCSINAVRDPHESALGVKGSPFLVMARVMGGPTPIDEHGDHHDIHCYEPTHWIPLPQPPKEDE